MFQTQNVKDILEAIDSVKARMRHAWVKGDKTLVYALGGDLAALDCCLQYQVKELLAAQPESILCLKKGA